MRASTSGDSSSFDVSEIPAALPRTGLKSPPELPARTVPTINTSAAKSKRLIAPCRTELAFQSSRSRNQAGAEVSGRGWNLSIRRLPDHFAAAFACAKTGNTMAARIAMMAITTRSSLSVNARFWCLMISFQNHDLKFLMQQTIAPFSVRLDSVLVKGSLEFLPPRDCASICANGRQTSKVN